MRRALLVLLTALLPAVLSAGTVQAAPSAAVAPTVTAVPANAGRGWPVSGARGVLDLSARGYVEE
jgi:hypothetical protein